MGEAKWKAERRRQLDCHSRPLRRARFDLYALGTRTSLTRVMARELSHWSDENERVIGLVFLDTSDEDYGWILMARDTLGRFRSVDLEISITNERRATEGLRTRIARAVSGEDLVALGHQGEDTNYATDVLAVPRDVAPDELHPFFRVLLDAPNRHPARSVLREIGPWLAPTDPDFVSEFQCRQFDQRLWEMYLWATFRELRFDVTQPEAPDFLCGGPGFSFAVEATTTAPSTKGPLAVHPDPSTKDEMVEFLAHYMAMKFGSALKSKLDKTDKLGRRYWHRGDAVDKPFVLAIADFHVPGGDQLGSMSYTQSALWPYLYGHRVEWELVDGQLVARAVKGPLTVSGARPSRPASSTCPGPRTSRRCSSRMPGHWRNSTGWASRQASMPKGSLTCEGAFVSIRIPKPFTRSRSPRPSRVPTTSSTGATSFRFSTIRARDCHWTKSCSPA